MIVLDTSAFIAGFDPLAVPEEQYTVPEVGKELIAGSMPWMRFNAAIENRKLTVQDSEKFSFSRDSGSLQKGGGHALPL